MTTIRNCLRLLCLLLAYTGLDCSTSVGDVDAFCQATSVRPLRKFAFSHESTLWSDKQSPNGDEQPQELENGGHSVSNQDDDDFQPILYNAVPLFTGSIISLFTLFLTFYGIYAGLTGDDPMSGHPKL